MILNGQYGKGGTGGLLPRINVTAPMGSTVTVNGNPTRKVSSLPSGYTELTYIESTGTQYIDTGVLPYNGLDAEFSFMATASGQNILFGSRTSGTYETSTNQYYFSSDTTYTKSFMVVGVFNSETQSVTSYTANTKYTHNLDTSNYGTLTSTPTNNIIIFGFSNLSSRNLYSSRLYNLKLYDSNGLVRNFIPCYRNSDSEIGLYDTVNNVFYTNQGTGSFVAGEEVFRYDCPSFGTYSVVGTLESQTKTESVLIDACQITNVTITY